MNNKIKIFCDGGSRGNPGPAACAFVVMNDNDELIFEKGVSLGMVTNNQAEYFGVIHALMWINEQAQKNTNYMFYLDSLLIVNQIKGLYQIKDSALRQRYQEVIDLLKKTNLSKEIFTHVMREQNSRADALVNKTLDQA